MTDSRYSSDRRGRNVPDRTGIDSEALAVQATHEPAIAFRAARLVAQAEAMGLIAAGDEPQGFALELFAESLRAFARVGIGAQAVATLGPGRDPSTVLEALEALDDEIETSPLPQHEWPAMIKRLNYELLARLTGVSVSSVRRYLNNERPTPDDIAARLHFLALLVADLAGGYNDYGIRRWFDRRRSQLGDIAPTAILTGDWDPDAEQPRSVRDLARSLAVSPVT
jgi:transcriptional regulator with XRE-family HTH domain